MTHPMVLLSSGPYTEGRCGMRQEIYWLQASS